MELYKTRSKQGYPIIYAGDEADVLFRENCPMLPYVVADGYDTETGEWDKGSYLDDLQEAIWVADGEQPCSSHVLDANGKKVDYLNAVGLMDDDLREELHHYLAPCSNQRFFEAYAEAHETKFGESFAPWVGGNW